MKFDRLMDFTTYAILGVIALSLIWAALYILIELKDIEEDMEEIDRMEYYCYYKE